MEGTTSHVNNAEKLEELKELEKQIAILQKQKVFEQKKLMLLNQKEDLKRKIIELNLLLDDDRLPDFDREDIYREIIKAQESLLFISGYYTKLISGEA